MPSAQDCAERLREQAYRTLLPQIRDLERELQNFGNSLSAGLHQIGHKVESLEHIELPAAEVVLSEILEEMIRQKDLETGALVLFARGVRQKETQEEILGFLLDGIHQYFPRVALLSVRGDQFAGWSSRGYSEQASKTIGSLSVARSENPELEGALVNGSLKEFQDFPDGHSRLQFLHQDVTGPWIFVALRALNRPVALVLAGGAGVAPRSSEALSIMMDLAALRLENVAYKILYELTVSRGEVIAQTIPTAAEPPSQPAKAMRPEATPEFQPIPAVPEAAETIEAQKSDTEPEAAPVIEVAASVPLTKTLPSVGEIKAPLPKPQPVEPQEVAGDEKLHSDAKRFARLLVSEIKLYNEHHMLEGRKNKDLYLRLKRDIDRSRDMYEKRVSPKVSRKIDYFHDEIIRILGDTDPSSLGSDYPGPRVES